MKGLSLKNGRKPQSVKKSNNEPSYCFICKNMKEFFKHTRRENKIYSFQEAIAHLHFEYSSSLKKNIVTKSCFSCPQEENEDCWSPEEKYQSTAITEGLSMQLWLRKWEHKSGL